MTTQIDDSVVIDGGDAVSCSGPVILESHPRIYKLSENEDNPLSGFSACWRAFIVEWEIKNNKLYLSKLIGKYQVLGEGAIFADWFTGTLRATKGEILVYGPNNTWNIYEFNIKIIIEQGVIIENHTIDNRSKDLSELISRYEDARLPPIF